MTLHTVAQSHQIRINVIEDCGDLFPPVVDIPFQVVPLDLDVRFKQTMNLKSKYLGLRIHDSRYQPRGNRRHITNGLGSLMKMSISPVPIVYPHHHQCMKDGIPQSFHIGQMELFRGLTVVGPELVVLVTLQKGVVVPLKLSLDQGVVLLPR